MRFSRDVLYVSLLKISETATHPRVDNFSAVSNVRQDTSFDCRIVKTKSPHATSSGDTPDSSCSLGEWENFGVGLIISEHNLSPQTISELVTQDGFPEEISANDSKTPKVQSTKIDTKTRNIFNNSIGNDIS